MEEILKPTARRTILVRGLAALAGALGLAVVDRKALAREPASDTSKCGSHHRMYGRRRQMPASVRPFGESSNPGHRLISQGELLAAADGEKIGEFYSTRFCLESSFGFNPTAASNLEFQTLKLKDGTLFGIAAGESTSGNECAHAILGGTGRYAGARGSYVVIENTAMRTPDGIEIVLNLSTSKETYGS